MMRTSLRGWAAICLLGLGLGGCGDDDSGRKGAVATAPLPALQARRGDRAGIYDEHGRQVLLRGVNLNALGDYYQGNPNYEPVLPVDDGDFAEMARYGLNVVRLIVSWSFLEPERDRIDRDYLRRIREVVDLAKAHDIYVILDMHQDAWGKYIATPPGVSCGGQEVAIGWDGAPEWATFTDGRSTCRPPGVRELAPAVKAAFNNFYNNREGIQEQFAKAWAALAAEFATDTTIAGYDLLNEPHFGDKPLISGTQLGPLYTRVFRAIRDAERAAGGFAHVLFFEPVVLYPGRSTLPPPASVDDPNAVFAPHNYAESINDVTTIEEWFQRTAETSAELGATFWVGEYGWFSDPPANKPKLLRYARQEDAARIGSAWWQWQQACGDPHTIGIPGNEPGGELIHFRRGRCPGDIDLGPIEEWTVVLSRPYPRASAGALLFLESDGDTRTATIRGASDGMGEVDLWVPDNGKGAPVLQGTGVMAWSVRPVPGGYRCKVSVSGGYEIRVS